MAASLKIESRICSSEVDKGAFCARLKVLHVLPSLAEAYGGPAQAMLHFADVLTAAGVDVTVAACIRSGERSVPLRSRGREGSRGSVDVMIFKPSTRIYTYSLGFFRWLLANMHRFDLVHVHGLFSFPPVAAGYLALWYKKPLIVRPFGVLNRYGLEHRRPLAKRMSIALVEGPLLRRASVTQFTAMAELEQAREAGLEHRGVVLPLGLATEPPGDPQLMRARFPRLAAGPVLLSLSRLDRAKNLEALLAGFAVISRRRPEASLLICGAGAPDYRTEIEELSRRLGLGESVIWAGDVRDSMKASAFAVADLFVLPSFSENFGISVVEAMAAGKPVVVTRGLPMHELIAERGAGLVAGTDPGSLAEALERALDGRLDLKRAGIAANGLVEAEYSLSAFGARLVELYGRLLPGTKVPQQA